MIFDSVESIAAGAMCALFLTVGMWNAWRLDRKHQREWENR